MTRSAFSRWMMLAATGVTVACGTARVDESAGPSGARASCIVVEVQNLSLRGVTVWIEWDGSAPRNLGRLGLNARRAFRQQFRNAEVRLHFQRDGATSRTASNPILPTPGDRLDVSYRESGASPLRRAGVARC